jgi:hypothetical protein
MTTIPLFLAKVEIQFHLDNQALVDEKLKGKTIHETGNMIKIVEDLINRYLSPGLFLISRLWVQAT